MKKKIKVLILSIIAVVVLTSCALFGEKKQCPAYSSVGEKIELKA